MQKTYHDIYIDARRYPYFNNINNEVLAYLDNISNDKIRRDLMEAADELCKQHLVKSAFLLLTEKNRKELYVHDYIDIFEKAEKAIKNKYMLQILEKQKKLVAQKIEETRKELRNIEKKLKPILNDNIDLSDLANKLNLIIEEEKETTTIINKVLELGKKELQKVREKNIIKFKEENLKINHGYMAIDTAKDTIALLLLHYALLERQDGFLCSPENIALIEEALYSRNIPRKKIIEAQQKPLG